MTQENRQNRRFYILMVEDNPDDILLVKMAFEELSIPNLSLLIGENVEVALDFMEKKTPFTDAPTPQLILLDYNLPGVPGLQMLMKLKQDSRFQHIPVVVISSSNNSKHVRHCYDAGADGYIAKPVDLHKFNRVIRDIVSYWTRVAPRPKNSNQTEKAK